MLARVIHNFLAISFSRYIASDAKRYGLLCYSFNCVHSSLISFIDIAFLSYACHLFRLLLRLKLLQPVKYCSLYFGDLKMVCQHPKLVDSFVSTILVPFRTPDNFVRYMFSFYKSI